MSINGIHDALHRKPFRSFSFGLVDGRTCQFGTLSL